jgi:acyl dehydratase
MAVNEAIVGKQYPALDPYLVGREKIREFARAVMSETALNTSVQSAQDAGFADLVAPPTFAVIVQERALALLLDDPDSGIDYARIVHGDQRFDYSRPIVAGDELDPVMSVTKVQSLGGHSMVTSETVVNDQAGHHVVTATSTLVVRGGES